MYFKVAFNFITPTTITIFTTSATNEESWLLIGVSSSLLCLKLVFALFLSQFPCVSFNFNQSSYWSSHWFLHIGVSLHLLLYSAFHVSSSALSCYSYGYCQFYLFLKCTYFKSTSDSQNAPVLYQAIRPSQHPALKHIHILSIRMEEWPALSSTHYNWSNSSFV